MGEQLAEIRVRYLGSIPEQRAVQFESQRRARSPPGSLLAQRASESELSAEGRRAAGVGTEIRFRIANEAALAELGLSRQGKLSRF